MVRDLTVGPPLRRVMGFCLLILVGSLFQQAYLTLESMFVGKYLGVELCRRRQHRAMFPDFGFPSVYLRAVHSSPSILGPGRYRRAEVTASIWRPFLFADGYAGGLLPAHSGSTPGQSSEDAVTFIATIFRAPLLCCFTPCSSATRALGTAEPPVLSDFTCVLNISLDLLLIGILRVGVGVAWATILPAVRVAVLSHHPQAHPHPLPHQGGPEAPPGDRGLCRTSVPLGPLGVN